MHQSGNSIPITFGGVHEQMAQKIRASLAGTPEGKRILELEREKGEIISAMEKQLPFVEYLTEPRNWWKYYPEYRELLDQLDQQKYIKPQP